MGIKVLLVGFFIGLLIKLRRRYSIPMRTLFICKRNENYGFVSYTRRSSGLYNSTRFIVEGLLKRGTHAKIVEVHDNNDIDREVQKFKPDVVIIEALWVVPEKFDVLRCLHPKVKWFCHLHSHMPFLALEGIAIEWIMGYANRHIGLIANSVESYEALRCILKPNKIHYLSNVYITHPRRAHLHCGAESKVMNIGCFGAMRPMKNHLLQALAAIEFARIMGMKLRFHINGSRIEAGGSPVLKNLDRLFKLTPHTELVQHDWLEPEAFLDILQKDIDLGMQVSLTETFNVVCADYVTAGIPIVVSKEVSWASPESKADDNSIPSIIDTMAHAWGNRKLVDENQGRLIKKSREAQESWYKFIHNL